MKFVNQMTGHASRGRGVIQKDTKLLVNMPDSITNLTCLQLVTTNGFFYVYRFDVFSLSYITLFC